MNDLFQWAIVAFIVLSIAWHVFKGGAANPESTGTIDRKVNGLKSEVSTLSTRVGHVEAEMKELKAEVATTDDVAKLKELFAAKLEGQLALSQATNDSVRRIERIILEKGLSRK